MVAVGRVNFVNAVVYHSGCEKIIKDGLGLGLVLCNELCNGIEGLRCGSYALYDFLIFVEINKLLCLQGG